MKKVIVCLFFAWLLAACGQNESTDGTEGIKAEPEEEAVVALEEDNESGEKEDTGEAEESDANEESEAAVAPDVQDDSEVDAAHILQKSFEAMSELTSVHMNASMDIHEKIDDREVIEEKTIDMTMLLQEPYSKHFALEIQSNSNEPIISEVYELPDSHYIHSSVHDVAWGTIPNPNGSQQPSPFVVEATLDNHLAFSSNFEVSEDGNEYVLTFSGAYDQFMTSVYGGAVEMLQKIGKEFPMELEDVINSYKITIDKDTFYVKYYNIHYEGQVSDGDLGYFVGIDGAVTVDEYNEHNEIIVPQEVLDEAVTMVDNAGNPLIGE
ncbi:DUF6612 family protein [Virgibacillus sp. W0181]|uniref:DUF6612 family protein n=1 Tax=Virgibacillus sp. W0181 TaxID=3391581 RepID=UPI003F480FC4